MPDHDKIFIEHDQAIRAIARDFEQYPFQLNLLTSLVPMVFGNHAYLMRDTRSNRLWLKLPERKKPFVVGESEIAQRLIRKLKAAPPTDEQLAKIGTLVFQAPVKVVAGDAKGARPGLCVDTGMDGFTCLQCGRCCRLLDYRDGCSLDDFRRWRNLGRSDILRWVGTVREAGQVVACRIWMVPGTNRFAEVCPWLKRGDRPDRFTCTIHDVRPTICREYPGSRKHARMTGCSGV